MRSVVEKCHHVLDRRCGIRPIFKEPAKDPPIPASFVLTNEEFIDVLFRGVIAIWNKIGIYLKTSENKRHFILHQFGQGANILLE